MLKKNFNFIIYLIFFVGIIFFLLIRSNNRSQVIVEEDREVNGYDRLVTVSVDDDAFLGDDNAPLVLIEFSSFECRFCRKSYFELLPPLKQFYINTGKLKFVYRDFPLPNHPYSRPKAQAAECARDQQGDAMYFEFHDMIFDNTDKNGKGLEMEEVYGFVDALELNSVQFEECMDTEKFADEVEKDLADGINAGTSSTPTWYIGKNSPDGMIKAQKIVGAVPYSVFQSIIEEMLLDQ